MEKTRTGYQGRSLSFFGNISFESVAVVTVLIKLRYWTISLTSLKNLVFTLFWKVDTQNE
ncbi:hypothetical protein EMIT019CA3_120084 [Bacillus pseudomycoides]